MKLLLLLISLLSSQISIAQSTHHVPEDLQTQESRRSKTIFSKASAGSVVTITLSVSAYSPSQSGALKDALLGYREKVLAVSLDELKQTLSFTYNEFMLLDDLIRLFEEQGISYHRGSSEVQFINDSK